MAVIGRTESDARLLSQAQQPASMIAFVSAKKSLTSRPTPCPPWSRRATSWAKRFQCPGGSSERGPSAQYSAIIFCSSVSAALSSSRDWACATYSGDPYLAGPVEERSDPGLTANVVTCCHCAPTKPGVTTVPPPS